MGLFLLNFAGPVNSATTQGTITEVTQVVITLANVNHSLPTLLLFTNEVKVVFLFSLAKIIDWSRGRQGTVKLDICVLS